MCFSACSPSLSLSLSLVTSTPLALPIPTPNPLVALLHQVLERLLGIAFLFKRRIFTALFPYSTVLCIILSASSFIAIAFLRQSTFLLIAFLGHPGFFLLAWTSPPTQLPQLPDIARAQATRVAEDFDVADDAGAEICRDEAAAGVGDDVGGMATCEQRDVVVAHFGFWRDSFGR